jgi:regulatory protein
LAATADDLRARALRLLARREYARQELATKLLSRPAPRPKRRAPGNTRDVFEQFAVEDDYVAPTEAEVNALLDDLEKRKMLSDDRYAEMRTRLRAPRYGNSRLQQELAQKGIETPLPPLLPNNPMNSRAVANSGSGNSASRPPI